jgi:copper chaperone
MTTTFRVPDISCQHCVNAITSEVEQISGVQRVIVDLGSKQVQVNANEHVTQATVIAAINEAGYGDVTVLNEAST